MKTGRRCERPRHGITRLELAMQLQLIAVPKTKQCRKCHRNLNPSDFPKDRGRKDGLFLWCKDCAKAHSARRWRDVPHVRIQHGPSVRRSEKRRIDRIRQIREFVGCQLCPEREWYCLDFHHVDPTTKSFTPSRGQKAVSWADMVAEICKCICLCANCHRKVHRGALSVEGLETVSLEQIDAALAELNESQPSANRAKG
jgi:hypothetical protein